MRKDFLTFLKAILIFSTIIALGILSISFATDRITSVMWVIFIYFIFITSVFHFGLLKSSEGKPQGFVRYYMGATTFKLMVHVMVILLYCLLNREQAVPFIVSFLIFYVLYTAFEVALAVKKFRKQS